MYLLICYVDHSILYEVIFQFFEGSNSTGAKPYSRPSTLLSTGANVPVAPVESAPMQMWQVEVRGDSSTLHAQQAYATSDQLAAGTTSCTQLQSDELEFTTCMLTSSMKLI